MRMLQPYRQQHAWLAGAASSCRRKVMAYIVMAYTVMAYIVMAYTVMAYIVMAYIVLAT